MLVIAVLLAELGKMRRLNLKIYLTKKGGTMKQIYWCKKIGKEILMLGNIEIEKNKFTAIKIPFFKRCKYWENVSF